MLGTVLCTLYTLLHWVVKSLLVFLSSHCTDGKREAAPSSLTWPRSSDWRWRAGRWAPFLRLQAGILTALKPSCLKLRECISEEIELSSPVRRLLAEVTGSQKEAMQKCKGGKGVFWMVPASLSRLTPEYHFHNKGKFSSRRRAGREFQVFASDVIHI